MLRLSGKAMTVEEIGPKTVFDPRDSRRDEKGKKLKTFLSDKAADIEDG